MKTAYITIPATIVVNPVPPAERIDISNTEAKVELIIKPRGFIRIIAATKPNIISAGRSVNESTNMYPCPPLPTTSSPSGAKCTTAQSGAAIIASTRSTTQPKTTPIQSINGTIGR